MTLFIELSTCQDRPVKFKFKVSLSGTSWFCGRNHCVAVNPNTNVVTWSWLLALAYFRHFILFECLLYSGDIIEGKFGGFYSPWCCSSESFEHVQFSSSLCAVFARVALRQTIKKGAVTTTLVSYFSVCPVLTFHDCKSLFFLHLQSLEHTSCPGCASTEQYRCPKILVCVKLWFSVSKSVLPLLSTSRISHHHDFFIRVWFVGSWFQNDGVFYFPASLEPSYIPFLSALYFTQRSSRTFTEGQTRDKDSGDRLGKYTQHGAPLVWELMLSCWWLRWRVDTERQRIPNQKINGGAFAKTKERDENPMGERVLWCSSRLL